MACGDDSYVLDSDGNRILIGLTLDETREFESLDELISSLSSAPTNQSRSPNERRWLVLYANSRLTASPKADNGRTAPPSLFPPNSLAIFAGNVISA